jgi:nucleoside-diphosphate-sugar epimerase
MRIFIAVQQSNEPRNVTGQNCLGISGGASVKIDECLEGTLRLMRSGFTGPVNIGSDEMVTIDKLVDIVAEIAGKSLRKRHIHGPTEVRGRNSDNRLTREKLDWSPSTVLVNGLRPTCEWIESQVMRNVRSDGGGLNILAADRKQINLGSVQ